MNRLLLCGAVLFLVACSVNPPPESPAEKAIERWVGRPIDAVIASWGEPTLRSAEGERRLFVWMATHYDRRYYPANLDTESRFPFLEGRDEISCKGVFEVDPEGVVRKAEWQGYECYFMP